MFTQLRPTTKATIFYALAFGMALLVALFAQGLGEKIALASMFTSLAAVLLMLLVITPDGYTRAGWQILGLNHLGLRSWGWAVGGPILAMSITYGIVWSTNLGHPEWLSLQVLLTPDGASNFLVSFAIGFVACLAEEIGWRGYLLPNLLGIGRVRAMLLTGFLHGVWHLPLMLLSPYYHAEGNRWIVVTLFVLTLTAAGLFYGY